MTERATRSVATSPVTTPATTRPMRVSPLAGRFAPQQVLALQRAAGNASMTPRPGYNRPLLSHQQLAAAREFYTNEPNNVRYPQSVVDAVQDRLGLPPGPPDTAFILAVARWQRDCPGSWKPSLDGMADASTLTRMFPSGLNTEQAGQAYRMAVRAELVNPWNELQSTDERIEMAFRVAHVRFSQVVAAAGLDPGVLTPGLQVTDGPRAARGQFDCRNWVISASRMAYEPSTGECSAKLEDTDDPLSLATTIYHEFRHAEQFLNILRMLAWYALERRSDPVEDVYDQIAVPMAIVREAVKAPWTRGRSRDSSRSVSSTPASATRSRRAPRNGSTTPSSDSTRR